MRSLVAAVLLLVLAAPALAAHRQPALGPEQKVAEGNRRMGFETSKIGTHRQRVVTKLRSGPVYVRETRLTISKGTFQGRTGAFSDRRTIDDGVAVAHERDFTFRIGDVFKTVPVTAPR